MPKTQVGGNQIKDTDVGREDINIATTGRAMVRKIIQGTGITLSSTGADSGTGDVTINVAGDYLLLTGGILSGVLKIADGTVLLPALAFNSNPDTGIYKPATGILALAIDGVEMLNFHSLGVTLNKPIFADDQSSGVPFYTFAWDGTTGIGLANTALLALIAGSITSFTVSQEYFASAHSGTKGIQMPNGTNLIPSYAFVNKHNAGMYFDGTSLCFSYNGTKIIGLNETDFKLEKPLNLNSQSITNPPAAVVTGLDADKLDGLHSGSFAPIAHVGSGASAHSGASTSVNGFMVAADKLKLDGLNSANYAPIAHVGAGGTQHPDATQSVAGFLSATDKLKIDNLNIMSGAKYIPCVPQLTSTSWDSDSYSTATPTTIDMSAVFGVPASGVKAYYIKLICRDSGSFASTDNYIWLGINSIAYLASKCQSFPNDMWVEGYGIVPCDANGDIQYVIHATGSLTMDVYIVILGYFIETTVDGFIPLTTPLTSTAWDSDARSTTARTLIDLSAVFGVPAGVKAVDVEVWVRDSASAGVTTFQGIILSPNSVASPAGRVFDCNGSGNDVFRRHHAIVPCDTNGDIYFSTTASGAGTLDVYLMIHGYWL